jgi:hypothetical protein
LTTYRNWARLNFEGRKEWGEIFPDGKVPIKNVTMQHVKLEGNKDPESVYTVDWKKLAPWQQEAIVARLSSQSGDAKDAIVSSILKFGLPLRRKYIQSAGTKGMELFF